MPSFDIVSELNMHEVNNGVDQANREVSTRYDFKGSDAQYQLESESTLKLTAQNDFQLEQMLDIIKAKFTKRGVDIACMDVKEPEIFAKEARQQVLLRQGLEGSLSKIIVKLIKDKKLKVQAAIQGQKVRVSGKKRDDLQQVISLMREQKLEMPLQYENFRD